MDLSTLKPGDVVLVRWPGSNSHANAKRTKVRVVNRTHTRVGVNVATTTPAGKYTGGYGSAVRWFEAGEVLGKEADL